MCSTQSHRSHDQRTELHCDIDQHRLPRGVELTLHLITECDYHRIDAEAGENLPHCLTAVSPELRVTLDPLLLPEVSLPAAHAPISFAAAPGVAQAVNDAAVREALCVFFNLTSGPQWSSPDGWCDPMTPICSNGTQAGWFGVGCDPTGQMVTSLQLSNNGLASPSLITGVDISPLFTVVAGLQSLLLDGNWALLLSRLDVSPLHSLNTLLLTEVASTVTGFQPLLLPSDCQLVTLSIGTTTFAVDSWAGCAQLTVVDVSFVPSPIPLAIISYMPALQQLNAENSALNGDAYGAYGGGLRGGELTQFILHHLNESNPQLVNLDLTGCIDLPFGSATASDTFPHIVSPSLKSLTLSNVALRTGPMGPIDARWLADMPSLTSLVLTLLPNVIVDTAAFAYSSRMLKSFACDSQMLGDLSPLFALPLLESLNLAGSAVRSQLPANISMVWPQLAIFGCSACNLYGPLPDFRHMPALTQLSLDGNALTGPIGVDFAKESAALDHLILSSNRLQSPMPSFCGSLQVLFSAFDSNLIDTFPDLRCYRHMQQLQLQSNPMRGQLPQDLWQLMPDITTLIISTTLINGTIPDRDPQLIPMYLFLASDCAFSGRLPRNIDALILDLSGNNFEGPLVLFDQRFGSQIPQMQSLTLASAGKLSCPIQLASFSSLTQLVISGNGFDECDWTNVTLPSTLLVLDISLNNWLPFDLTIPPAIVSLRAARSNVRGLVMSVASLSLVELSLDESAIVSDINPQQSVSDQLAYLLSGVGSAPALRVFSCVGCGISIALDLLMPMISSNPTLEQLDLSSNRLWSQFPTDSGFNSFQYTFPLRMTEFRVADNGGIRGRLPQIANGYQLLRSLDFTGTQLSGPIPSSWSNMPALTQLNIAGTNIGLVPCRSLCDR